MPAKPKTCQKCNAPYETILVTRANGSTHIVTGCPRHWRQPASGSVPGAAPAPGQAAKPVPAKPAKEKGE